MLYIAGENIRADASVVRDADGMVYSASTKKWGELIGTAAEEIREGFRVRVRGFVVREDDA